MFIYVINSYSIILLCHKSECTVLWNLCKGMLLASEPKTILFKGNIFKSYISNTFCCLH